MRVECGCHRGLQHHGEAEPRDQSGATKQRKMRDPHRKQDREKSLPYRPWHTHDESQPLTPGREVELDVEIWPTCIVIPKGYRIALTVRGKDYEYEGEAAVLSNMKNPMRGCGPFVHDDAQDRPPELFGGKVALHADASKQPQLLLPIIP